MTLEEVAQALGAELVARSGEAQPGDALRKLEITGVAALESAGNSQISFLTNPRYTAAAARTGAAAVLVEPSFGALPVPTLRITNAYLAFASALKLFHPQVRYAPGVHPTAVIAADVVLPPDIHIGPYVVVGEGVRLREGSVLLAHSVLYPGVEAGPELFCHAHVVVREDTRIGARVILGNGVVLGGDGFGFARDGARGWSKIPQTGRVILGDDVEVQANSCVDRASVGETRIDSGAKLDNLVQVGHGSEVGEHTLLCAQVGLAGSSHIGRDVVLAGQVGVAGHLSVGDRAIATAQSGLPSDVAAGETVSGYPAIANRQWLRASAAFSRLPEILRRLAQLERAGGKADRGVQ